MISAPILMGLLLAGFPALIGAIKYADKRVEERREDEQFAIRLNRSLGPATSTRHLGGLR